MTVSQLRRTARNTLGAVLALALVTAAVLNDRAGAGSDQGKRQTYPRVAPLTLTPAPASPSQTAPAERTTSPAAAAVMRLTVKGRAPMTGYDREQFGQAWTDDVTVPLGHNGCDTRSDILRISLQQVVIKPNTHGCVPQTGTLHDPYTGEIIEFQRGRTTSSAVQIEHAVALGDAWQSGAQQMSIEQRENLANDPLNLLAVSGAVNASKGAANAASWLPPNKSYRCQYIARQAAVKAKYGLWVTAAEQAAMSRVLTRCTGQQLPTGVVR